MSYKVIIDSCGELTEEMKKSGHFETASLQIDVDGHHIVDDESFDQADFLRRVKASGECPKSSWSVAGKIYGRISLRCGTCICSDIVGRT